MDYNWISVSSDIVWHFPEPPLKGDLFYYYFIFLSINIFADIFQPFWFHSQRI